MDLTLIFLIALGMIAQGAFIVVEHNERWVAAVILKGLASALFVSLGIYCSTRTFTNQFDCLIIAGLVFGLVGDVFLNLRHVFKSIGDKIFLVGVASFLIGHIIYLIAVTSMARHILIDVIIGIVLAAALLAYIFKTMKVKIAFKIFGIFYLGAIIVMTVMALDAAIFFPSTKNMLFAFGALLFTASDVILIFNTFSGKETFSKRIANLSLYYIGQVCIATTTMFIL